MLGLGMDVSDVIECLIALTPACFDKTMPAEKAAGLWQDVYRPRVDGRLLYVKIQIVGERPSDSVVVVSFKTP
jgi:hypothetical protein